MSDEKPAAGGTGLRGDALKRLRRARPSAAASAERLQSGRAWADFCRSLEAAGEHLREFPIPDSPELRAEGFRYLLGLLSSGVNQALWLADPDQPRFWRNPDSFAKWGAENADNQYLWARVRPDASYEIRGQRSTAFDFLIEAKEGFMQLGDDGVYACLKAHELEIASDGSFEILLAQERPAGHRGNWLALHPKARYIQIRQYFADWGRESPARFEIRQLGNEGRPPAPLTPARMAEMLDDAGEWVDVTARFWTQWIDQMREAHDPKQLKPAIHFVGGADDIFYGNDMYRIGPDEALVIESAPPDARYWQIQLCDIWFRTLDYATRQSSLNHEQARLDADGRFRCVIAHRDPGVANWLDTAGYEEGMIQYRWVWSRSNPHPTLRRVRFDEIAAALPAGTVRITPEERRREIAARQAHVARREPAT
jgi:hypothetical protein